MSEDVQLITADGVAEVRLNRPALRNAISMPMFEELAETAERVAARQDLRAVVLTGEGESFCSGLDTANFTGDGHEAEEPSPRLARLLRSATENDPGHDGNLGQYATQVWAALPVPVIAAVRGHALGAGLQLALAADLRVVAPDATLSMLEIRWGLVPDLGGIPRVVDLAGPEVAMDLALTGRMISGTEAHRLGLAGRLGDDPLAAAHALAARIAAASPDAVRQIKRLVRAAPRPLAQALADEARVLTRLRDGANHREAVCAAVQRRPAVFVDPSPHPHLEGAPS